MKIILKNLIFLHILVICNFTSYAFDVDKHSSNFDQSLKAMIFDSFGTSYLYEESADMSSQNKLSYKVVVNDQEYLLPIAKNKGVITQFGFLNHYEYYKTIFMIVPSENKLLLAYLPKDSDKDFLIKELKIGSYEGSLNSYHGLVSNGNLIIESGNNKQVYIFDRKTDSLKDFIKTGMDRKVTDYIEKNNQSYLLFIGEQVSNENTIYLSVFNDDMSLKKEIEYSADNKVIDSRFLGQISTDMPVVIQTFKKDLFPSNLISNVYKVNFNLLKSEAVSVGHLFSRKIINNPENLDSLVFCGVENSIYWINKTDDLRAKLAIKSTGSDEHWVDLPEMAYVEKVFISLNDNKIMVMANFGKRLGKFFTQGFGSDELELKCQ